MVLASHISSSGESAAHWARRLGISRGYLSEMLAGKKLPSLTLAVTIERETGGAVPASSWVPEPKKGAA